MGVFHLRHLTGNITTKLSNAYLRYHNHYDSIPPPFTLWQYFLSSPLHYDSIAPPFTPWQYFLSSPLHYDSIALRLPCDSIS